MLKLNKIPFGITLGALAPVLGIMLYYFIKVDTSEMSLGQFLERFFKTKSILTTLGSLFLIVNIVFFTLFVNAKSDKTAIGIFIMTVMYGLIILYAKFFM